MAINNANHEGNPQDGYNKIQNGNYPYQQMVDESEYVLTQQEDGTYKVTKKPKDATIATVTDLQDFLKDQMVGMRERGASRITPRLRNNNDRIVCYRD